MGENIFRNMLIGMVLFSLVGVLMLTVVINTGSDYGKNLTEVTGGALDIELFNNSVKYIESNATGFMDEFKTSGQETKGFFGTLADIIGFLSVGVFKIATGMITLVLSPIAMITGILETNLHIPRVVTGVLTGLFILTVIFAVWRLIKVGD